MEVRGYSHPDFRALRDVVRWCAPKHGPGGAAIAVYHRGELVADLACGTRNRAGAPFEPQTLALSMSTGKGVMATLLHQMVDRGLVELDAPVARYWPEFARNGKGAITVRQAASHRAGLYSIARVIDSAEEMFDWDHMIRVVEDMWPVHKPDTDFGYHAWTGGWIIGEVLQRVTSKRFPDLIEEYLAEPLQCDGLYMGLPQSELPRVAEFLIPAIPRRALKGRSRGVRATVRRSASTTVRWHSALGQAVDAMIPPGLGKVLGDPRWLTSIIPSGNGVFNARSLARLYGALSLGGSIDGVRLLSAATLAEATEDQNAPIGRVIPFPLRFKVGYMRPVSLGLRMSWNGHVLDLGLPNPHAFGHFGFGGSGAWADPERQLGVAVVTNCFGGRIPGDLRPVAVATATSRCADRRPC
ncbi:MAG: serine hydrolase domain-containing protein [Myxococcales bacterium]|jgi:CubicO group peptidase (beta-lactamase class C family)